MAKPHPAMLDSARYPFHCAIAMRFGDLDTNVHLNNVALVGILEDARVRFHAASGFHTALHSHDGTAPITVMVANLAVEYLGQAWYPKPLDVHVAIARTGRTSYVLQQLVKQEDSIVSFAQSVMVCVAENRPAPIPAAFLAGLAGWMLRP